MSDQTAFFGTRRLIGSESRGDWYTPPEYAESIREALGGEIGLDPFSCEAANAVIQAGLYFDEQDNAFDQDWYLPEGGIRTAYMNPPYQRGLIIQQAMSRFIDEYRRGSFDDGIVLVNNATETAWFQRALHHATAMCLPDRRIMFWDVHGKPVSKNTRGQAFLYFGKNARRFIRVFDKHGYCVRTDRIVVMANTLCAGCGYPINDEGEDEKRIVVFSDDGEQRICSGCAEDWWRNEGDYQPAA